MDRFGSDGRQQERSGKADSVNSRHGSVGSTDGKPSIEAGSMGGKRIPGLGEEKARKVPKNLMLWEIVMGCLANGMSMSPFEESGI